MKYALPDSAGRCRRWRATAHAQTPHLPLRQHYTNDAAEAQARAASSWKAATSRWSQGTRVDDCRRRVKVATRRAVPPAGSPRVDADDQRARDGEARRILEAELKKAEARQSRAGQGIQQRRARKAGPRASQPPEVPGPRGRDEGRASRATRATSPASSASWRRRSLRQNEGLNQPASVRIPPASSPSTCWPRWWRWFAATARCCSPIRRSKTRSAPRAARIEGSQFGACFTRAAAAANRARRRRAATSSRRCATTPGCAASTTSRCRCT